jgi:hypothetical protein
MRSIAVTQYLQRWESLNNGQLPCQPSHLEMAFAIPLFQVVNVENAGPYPGVFVWGEGRG